MTRGRQKPHVILSCSCFGMSSCKSPPLVVNWSGNHSVQPAVAAEVISPNSAESLDPNARECVHPIAPESLHLDPAPLDRFHPSSISRPRLLQQPQRATAGDLSAQVAQRLYFLFFFPASCFFLVAAPLSSALAAAPHPVPPALSPNGIAFQRRGVLDMSLHSGIVSLSVRERLCRQGSAGLVLLCSVRRSVSGFVCDH